MSIWSLLLLIAGLGAAGGLVNALMSDNGFVLPKREAAGGRHILRPGFLGNAFLGAIAAVIFWGLYGPYAEVNVVGTDPRQQPSVAGATRDDQDSRFGETLSGLIAALVVGVGGARVITSEVDKRMLQATAAEAATKTSSPSHAARIASATPAGALSIATSMPAPPE